MWTYLLEIPKVHEEQTVENKLREEDPSIFVLSRNRFPEVLPKGRQLENIRQQMLRIRIEDEKGSNMSHRDGKMSCPDCVEAQKPRPHPPAALGITWQQSRAICDRWN
jgi:hypothetical protein